MSITSNIKRRLVKFYSSKPTTYVSKKKMSVRPTKRQVEAFHKNKTPSNGVGVGY